MFITKESRLVIYLIKDNKIIDDYIISFLKKTECISNDINVLVKKTMSDEEKLKISSTFNIITYNQEKVDDIFCYALKNIPIDKNIKEIVFITDEWFGPVFSLDELFLNENKDGIKCLSNNSKQDFFVVNIKKFETKNNIKNAIVDNIFSKKNIDELIDFSELKDYSQDPLEDFPQILIQEKKFPLIKKSIFLKNYKEIFDKSNGKYIQDLMKFIKNNTDYDDELILKYLIRTQNMADIKKILHNTVVLSSKYEDKRETNTIKKIALQLHLYYDDQAEFCKHYVMSMPENTDVFITVPTEEKKIKVEKVFKDVPYNIDIRVIGNRGRDVGSLLTGVKDVIMNYDLVCSVHDKKVMQLKPLSIGESWAYKCFENLLSNDIYVNNVINYFEDNPLLGMMMPPPPIHANYYITIGKVEWSGSYKLVSELANKLNIKIDIDKNKEPVAPLGTMFWFRPKALKGLFDQDWQYTDYPKEPNKNDDTLLHAIERFYPFVVQNEGYYTSWLLLDKYSKIEIDNVNHFNRNLSRLELKIINKDKFSDVIEAFKNEDYKK